MFELFGIVKLTRVLRLNKVIAFLMVDQDLKSYLKLAKMIFFLAIYLHFFACIWYLLISGNRTWIPPIMIGLEDSMLLYSMET